MKSVVVIQIIAVCMIFTIFSILTLDGLNVRRAEIQQVVLCEMAEVVDKYFRGEIPELQLEETIKNSTINAIHSKADTIEVYVYYANAMYGIIHVRVEEVYTQPNGSQRMLSCEKVFIREAPRNGAVDSYSFTRSISREYYKNADGTFVSQVNGGLRDDSIWKTPEYSAILDSAFAK